MTSNALKYGLAASLALNLFIVGAVVGAAGMQARHNQRATPQRPPSNTSALMRAADALPEARRAAYIERLNAAGELARKDFVAAREVRTKASDLIGAPTYDRPKVSALLGQARNIDQGTRARFEETVLEYAATLSPEERKVFAERLKPPVPKRRDNDGKDDRNDRDRDGSDRNDRRDTNDRGRNDRDKSDGDNRPAAVAKP